MGRMSLQILLHKLYDHLAMPLGFIAITLVMTQNMPLVRILKESVQERSDNVPHSPLLRFQESMAFQHFIYIHTPLVLSNQCLLAPVRADLIPGPESLY